MAPVSTSLEGLLRETPAQRWKRRLKKAALNIVYVALAYALIVGGARLLHRRVVYQPPDDAVGVVPEGATLMTAKAADGEAVNALEFAASNPSRTIVHFHGNAETAEANAFLGREMKKRGFSMVLVEYRGYGRSRGGASPTEDGLYADAAAILDVLAARGVGPEKIVLWGQSLGSGVAVEMAKRGRGSRLVLVAPYTSMVEMASRNVPVLPASIVMMDRYDNLSKAPSINAPALVVHGDIDDVIPFEQGERLSKAFPHGTFMKVEEGRHDNLYKSTTVLSAIAAHVGG